MNCTQNRKIITKNLYAGEKALRQFKSEFPYTKSNTQYNRIINRHADDERYSHLIPILRGLSTIAGLKVQMIRNTYNQSKDKINFLKNAVKFQKIANCQECSFLICKDLKEMGVSAQNVRLNFVPKNGENMNKNHAFTVIGLDEKADISNPKTWGKNAVIVDAWANTVKRAEDGIQYIKDLFNFNPEVETCEYTYHRNI